MRDLFTAHRLRICCDPDEADASRVNHTLDIPRHLVSLNNTFYPLSMAQLIDISWSGASNRAQPIPQEEWDKYKDELSELYKDMTLDMLMQRMKTKHGFAPS